MFVVDTVNDCYYGFVLYATGLTYSLVSYLVVTSECCFENVGLDVSRHRRM
jgi:hypothetical protein